MPSTFTIKRLSARQFYPFERVLIRSDEYGRFTTSKAAMNPNGAMLLRSGGFGRVKDVGTDTVGSDAKRVVHDMEGTAQRPIGGAKST